MTPGSSQSAPNVLIVDDEFHARSIIGTHVRRMGCNVYEAAGGIEALAILQSTYIALVITDVWMPAMSGIDLLKTIRAQDPDLPIAMISAKATLESSLEAINLGAFAYITKPFRAEEVQNTVKRGLAKAEEARMRRALAHYTGKLSELETQLSQLSDTNSAFVPRNMLTDLISGLRHELGNMATAIKLNLELIRERGNIPDHLRENLADLQASADDLISLLVRFKEYPEPTKQMQVLDLRDAVISAVDALEGQKSFTPNKILVDLPEYDVPILGASTDLNRAIFHLLENAIEASVEDRSSVFVGLRIENNRASLSIEDQGPGFDESTLSRPFSPSYTTKIDDGFVRGLGFGLFVTKLVISLHGGDIRLENRSEGGARVVIELPLTSVKQEHHT